MVIVGVIAAALASRIMPQTIFQVQAGRDLLVSAFFVAQQKAMTQNRSVRLSTSGAIVDIRLDDNGDDVYAASESIRIAGTNYPIQLQSGVSVTSGQFVFDALGHTTSGTVNVTKGAHSVTVNVTGTGYAY